MDAARVPIRVANKRAFVWDVDDIAKLRSEHRICGILGGTLPHLSQQNVFLGVPLLLSPEEVVLLVEKNAAVIVDDPNAYPPPNTSEFQQWLNEQQQILEQQLTAFEAKNAKDSVSQDRAMSEEAIRKRKERELKRQQKAALLQQQQQQAPDEPGPSTIVSLMEDEPQPQPSQSTMTPASIVIPAPSTSFAWYSPEKQTYDSIESAQEAGIWDFPSNNHERARCNIYRDIWEQGYFLGGGIKFGSEYLVYPGDPMRYHSHFAASVIDSPETAMRPMEIVAHGRLGTATKKTHLLCSWDENTKKVSYISIEWAGFG